jgi:hypothetical protein
MGRFPLWLARLTPVLAVAACGAAASSTVAASHLGQTYRDKAGWTIEVPPGWHAVRFSDAKDGITAAGVQLSNVQLPPPTLISGYPIQVNNQVLPSRGVGLIIATDTDPSLSRDYVAVPPLPVPTGQYWTTGSALAGTAYMQTLWFRVNNTTFIACAKIGPKAASGDLYALAAIIHSLR